MLRAQTFAIAAIAGLAMTTVSLPAAAQPQSVSPLDVVKAPTTLRVSVAGKDVAAVRRDVRVAAYTVCRNAVTNYELDFFELGNCSDAARWTAMKHYSEMVRQYGLASSGEIVLAAR